MIILDDELKAAIESARKMLSQHGNEMPTIYIPARKCKECDVGDNACPDCVKYMINYLQGSTDK